MLCGSLAFALMGTLAHALGPRCDWQVIALVRSLLPLAICAFLARRAGARLVFWRPRTLWVRSCAGSVSLVCTFYALTRLEVSDVLTLTNMFPLWVALLSWPLLRERPAGRVWLAVACGLAGVVLIQQPHLAEGNFVALLALASSLFTAVAMLGLHRLQDIDARAIVVHFSAVALVFAAASFFMFERRAPVTAALEWPAPLMLIGVGAAATLGQLCLTRAFAAGPPAKVAVVALTQVVFAMGFEVALFGRSYSPATLLGIGLVLAPTAWLLASLA
jgi:drug/metabolite transporter (DMT)-like permease